MAKKPELNPHFPSGKKSITLSDLPEDTWWTLIYALRARVDFHKRLRYDYVKLNSEDLQKQIDSHTASITELLDLLDSIESQIAPGYWTAAKREARREEKLKLEYT